MHDSSLEDGGFDRQTARKSNGHGTADNAAFVAGVVDDAQPHADLRGGSSSDQGNMVKPYRMPSVPDEDIRSYAGDADAEQKVKELASNRFWAENSTADSSTEAERLNKKEAQVHEWWADCLYDETKRLPAVLKALSRQAFAEPASYVRFLGMTAIILELVLLGGMGVVIPHGIAAGGAIDAVADNPWLGLPFALPAICGVAASPLMRKVLTACGRTLFDYVASIAVILGLAMWLGAYSETFLGSVTGYGKGSGIVDLRIYYATHLFLEFVVALALAALAERCLTGHLLEKVEPNPAMKIVVAAAAAELEEARRWTQAAEVVADRRARLSFAAAEFESACLGRLRAIKSDRQAAIAWADADHRKH